MAARYQHTIKKEVNVTGIGLHSGKKVLMSIRPAPENTGICFKRVDQDLDHLILASYSNVTKTRFCTSVGVKTDKGIIQVSTIEHLMAAFSGLGVDNAIVEVDGPEIPSMDGSAAPFFTMIKKAGLKAQPALRRFFKIKYPVTVAMDGKEIRVEPCQDFWIDFSIDFDHALIKRQHFSSRITSNSFGRYIAKARTFGFLHEVESLQQNGYALGGSLDNAVVVGKEGVLNGEGLRSPDEFVRHKVLDLIGDLYLLGYPILGKVISNKSGHTLHHMLLTELMARRDVWEIIETTDKWPAIPLRCISPVTKRLEGPRPIPVPA